MSAESLDQRSRTSHCLLVDANWRNLASKREIRWRRKSRCQENFSENEVIWSSLFTGNRKVWKRVLEIFKLLFQNWREDDDDGIARTIVRCCFKTHFQQRVWPRLWICRYVSALCDKLEICWEDGSPGSRTPAFIHSVSEAACWTSTPNVCARIAIHSSDFGQNRQRRIRIWERLWIWSY